MDHAIEAEGLVKTYPGEIRALDGLGFQVGAGTVFGMLGPNGAGKSTTVKILTTLSRPDEGRAIVAGFDVLERPNDVRRAIGVVAQRSGVDREATGRENLRLQGHLFDMGGRPLELRVVELLERLGLAEAADRIVKTYSGGMQRRLDIALGLVHHPKVLFLDEPTTGLDPEVRAAMWEEITRLATEEGLTIFLTTHYLEEADRLAGRLVIVDRGRIVAEGTPDELKGELKGDAVTVELVQPDPEGRVALRARAPLPRARGAGGREYAAGPIGRRRARRSGDPAVARGGRRPGGERHRLAPVARRRLPSADRSQLHRRRVRGRGRRGRTQGTRGGPPMTTALRHTWYMTQRHLRALFRQPVWIAITLVQPIIWILLYGALFKRIVDIPGFGSDNYIDFLTPGIVLMTSLFSGGWAGMALIEDIHRGVTDRFLVTPVSRGALIAGRLVQLGITAVIQSAILLTIGVLLGASYSANPGGLFILVFCGVLLGAAFGALSTAMAVVVRKEETVIAAVNFVILPLTFLSAVFITLSLAPGWIRTAARFNPVNWAVEAGRGALDTSPDWGLVFARVGLLMAFALVCAWLATRAFRAYQRSV